MNTSSEAAQRLLGKLRKFIEEELDDEESALMAALVAPGVASVYAPEPEVSGFSQSAQWLPSALPDALATAIRDRNIHIEGL